MSKYKVTVTETKKYVLEATSKEEACEKMRVATDEGDDVVGMYEIESVTVDNDMYAYCLSPPSCDVTKTNTGRTYFA
tara:strand:+ start:173 stop:403 length:231 start_codon:yes stop_codon:yes gene_type:complete